MNLKSPLSPYQKQYRTQWCILLGCILLFAYYIYDDVHRTDEPVTMDELTHIVGRFTEVRCKKRVLRGVPYIDFTFKADDGRVIQRAAEPIESTIYCSDKLMGEMVTKPSSRVAEVWLLEDKVAGTNKIAGINFGHDVIANTVTYLSMYNFFAHSNKKQYILLLICLGINFKYWYSKWKLLSA